MRDYALVMAAVLLFVIVIPSIASPTGLIIIPTAETVGNGMYSFEMDIAGSISGRTTDSFVFNSEFGLGDRFETGLDYASGPDSPCGFLLNAKYILKTDLRHSLSYAIGIYNQAPDSVASTYVVATRRTSNLGLHMGIADTDAVAWFVGIDHPISNRWISMADYTSGSGNSSSFGLLYQASNSFSITIGSELPNSGGETQYVLQFIYAAPYTR
jgi:hypothetical protein